MKKSLRKHSFYAEADLQSALDSLLENEPARAKSRVINMLLRAGMPEVIKEIHAQRRKEVEKLDALAKQHGGKAK